MTEPSAGGVLCRVRALLIEDAGHVLKRAWSVKLLGISFVFDGLETFNGVITAWQVHLPIAPGVFAVLAGITTVAAGIARFIAQKKKDA